MRLVIRASVPLLFVIQIFQVGGLVAAPAVESITGCRRGTDETRSMLIWYAEGRTASTRRWSLRSYIVHLPPSYDGTVPFPVVINIHGGGGNKEAARLMTCPKGDLNDPGCLDRVADCEGFIAVYPDGTPHPMMRDVRTFNAGGGADGYACSSGYACANRTDDIRFFTDLLDTLEKIYTLDPARIYVTGLSNGGAMSHRLACELSNRIAGIAPVAGGNQFSAVDYCYPARSVPVLEIHGTNDRCWPYRGGEQTCVGQLSPGIHFSILETVAGWASRNGCQPTPIVQNLPDLAPTDGTTVTRMSFQECSNGGDVVLLRINGGGHTWPGGSPLLPLWMVGKVSQEFNFNRAIWEFFKAHPMR